MSTQIASKDLRSRGWSPGPALGKALKAAKSLIENGKNVDDVLMMF